MDEELPPEIRIDVYDGDYQRLGTIDALRSVELIDRFNAAGALAFEIDDDADMVEDLQREDARVVATYTPEGETEPAIYVSGGVEELEAVDEPAGEDELEEVQPGGTLAFAALGDLQILDTTLGYPNPGGSITQQGDEGAYYTVTGPIETVIKRAVTANAARLGLPLRCAPDLGRGPRTSVQIRMHALSDKLLPALGLTGLGLRIVQDGETGLLLDVWEPEVYDDTLTMASGAVVSGKYKRARPTVTRVTIGAGGEGTARVFREYIDHDLEARYGGQNTPFIREAFKDARDIDPTKPGWQDLMEARAMETLAEGSPKVGLQIELAETEAHAIGRSLWLGDAVTVELARSGPIHDRVREVGVTWDATSPIQVRPRIGQWTDDTTADMYRLIGQLMAAQREERTR